MHWDGGWIGWQDGGDNFPTISHKHTHKVFQRFGPINVYENGFGLKKNYEIVDEARPLSGFFPTQADFLQKCISNHETKQASKFQS